VAGADPAAWARYAARCTLLLTTRSGRLEPTERIERVAYGCARAMPTPERFGASAASWIGR